MHYYNESKMTMTPLHNYPTSSENNLHDSIGEGTQEITDFMVRSNVSVGVRTAGMLKKIKLYFFFKVREVS